MSDREAVRHLVLILGDQLDAESAALADLDPVSDVVCMFEVPYESTRTWSHVARTAVFLSAMRHFAAALTERGIRCDYAQLGRHTHPTLDLALTDAVRRHRPHRVVMVEAGEWQIAQNLASTCAELGVPLDTRVDTHFLVSRDAFAQWAGNYRQLRMEHFYRKVRKDTGVLMNVNGEPEQGRWNFDAENRGSFGSRGPGMVPTPPHFAPDAITREVFDDVRRHFADHPGDLASFGWPVTRSDALVALAAFMRDRLPWFGSVQDAMWTGEPWLFHSLLSAAMNLKLLNPREVVDAAVAEYRAGRAPIEAVEGFVRQILGWREFMRGMYWLDMPGMRAANHFDHHRRLPAWYWTGRTHMRCMQEVVGQTLTHGYAHHIQRLMVTGQFALLAQITPQEVEDWYLAVYVDAVEWVELPNVAGMAIYANGGRFTSKPYVASGAYIKRMSNYCDDCRYKPDVKSGPRACPVTTLYWHFLDTHEAALLRNPRTNLMAKNIGRMKPEDRADLRATAERMLSALDEL
ncbi:MAG: cryptochrome/photolyase family protein [Vicinamibacterales bacterium]